MDFRSEAVKATLSALGSSPGAALTDLYDSGIIPVSGGRRWQIMVELPTLFISTACMCAVPSLPILALRGLLPLPLLVPLLVVNLGILLVLRRFKSWFLSAYLSSRKDSLMKAFGNLPKKYVGIEDGNTYKKTKLVIEDEGVCLLDSQRQRLLIEACSHRYIIYGKDVRSVSPVSAYALSGALLHCTLAGKDIKIMFGVAGHGPLTSLTEAFAPKHSAKGLVTILQSTLFGIIPLTNNVI